MVSADDRVGRRWSNLVEGVEFSLTPPPSKNSWYAVPLQQPVRKQRRHTLVLKTEKPLNSLSALNSHNETCSGIDQALIHCHGVFLAPVSSGSGQMQGYGHYSP